MKFQNIPLSRIDRMILQSYVSLVDGLSEYLGEGYELVLHSLEDLDRSVIKIVNGFHTGRKEGSPITDLALSMFAQLEETDGDTNSITYFSKNKKGEPLKSTTICIRGEKGRIIGLLCINFYLHTSIASFIHSLTPQEELGHPQARNENFVENTEDLISEAINEVRAAVYEDDTITASLKHKEIIRRLNERGIFRLKDSVIRAADMLNLSKNTVYLHLRNLSKE